jgi:ribosomal protein S18 acetylase RimI-like enzyme
MERLRLETVSAANAMVFKDVRLRALSSDPSAFGSTYAEESRLTDAEWGDLAMRRTSEGSTVRLAFVDDVACGMVGAFLEESDRTRARLVSMWVAKEARQKGVGRALVDAVIAWARESVARTMVLTVTSNNDRATRFYERLGFEKTGRTEPYPNDPAVFEYEMARALITTSRR